MLRLGHFAPLTDPQAHLGKDNENGARQNVNMIDPATFGGFSFAGRSELFGLTATSAPEPPSSVASRLRAVAQDIERELLLALGCRELTP